jgi:uncharacterized protein YeeX (DUF496 family)
MQEPFLSEMYKHLDDLEIRLLLLHQITEFIDENDMNSNNVEMILGEWATEFNKRVG